MSMRAEPVPPVLLPYQRDWVKDDPRVSVIEKSRRIGISWAEAADAVVEAASTNGCDVWYVGYNKDMAQEFVRDCAFWSRMFGEDPTDVEEAWMWDGLGDAPELFDGDPDKYILIYTIRFASGWRITALSSRPTNLRNKRGRIIIDEAAFHPDLRGLLKAALAVRMWGGRSRVKIISTHNGVDSDFNKIVEKVRANKLPYRIQRTTIDSALKQGLYKRICLVNNLPWSPEREQEWMDTLFEEYGDDADEELRCVPTRSGGVYIPRPLIERQMRPGEVLRLDLDDSFLATSEDKRRTFVENWCIANLRLLLARWPKSRPTFFGEDFGRTSDRTVITPGFLTQKLVRHFPWAVELRNVPFEQQRQILFYIVDRLRGPYFLGGALDATGNGAYLAEQAALRYGLSWIDCIHLTEKWYAENLPAFKQAFEDRMIEVVRDADHLVDLTHFRKINGIPKLPKAKTNPQTGEGPPRHGDAGIAYLLGHAASRRATLATDGYEGVESSDRQPHDDDEYGKRNRTPAVYRPKTRGPGLL